VRAKKRDAGAVEKAEDAVDFYDQEELMDYTPEDAQERWFLVSLWLCSTAVQLSRVGDQLGICIGNTMERKSVCVGGGGVYINPYVKEHPLQENSQPLDSGQCKS